MFNLLIISVNSLHRHIISLRDSLILSNSSSNRHILSPLLSDLLHILSLIRNLNITDLWLVISVGFLNWDVLDVGLGLGLRLLVDGGGRGLGLDDRLNQGVLNVLHGLLEELGGLVDRHLGDCWLEYLVLGNVAWSHFLNRYFV